MLDTRRARKTSAGPPGTAAAWSALCREPVASRNAGSLDTAWHGRRGTVGQTVSLSALFHLPGKAWAANAVCMTRSRYDLHAQMLRAEEWLDEARRADLTAMRELCLNEAARCHRIIQLSLDTPVLRIRPPDATSGRHSV